MPSAQAASGNTSLVRAGPNNTAASLGRRPKRGRGVKMFSTVARTKSAGADHRRSRIPWSRRTGRGRSSGLGDGPERTLGSAVVLTGRIRPPPDRRRQSKGIDSNDSTTAIDLLLGHQASLFATARKRDVLVRAYRSPRWPPGDGATIARGQMMIVTHLVELEQPLHRRRRGNPGPRKSRQDDRPLAVGVATSRSRVLRPNCSIRTKVHFKSLSTS